MKFQKLSLTITTVALFLSGFTAANESEQQDIEALISDGVALHDQRRYDDAIALYERALKLEPDNAFAAYEMALTYQAAGNLPACIRTASEALQRGDESNTQDLYVSGLYTLLASCHSASGDSEDALQVFRDGLRRFPNNYSLHLNIAVTLVNSGDPINAKQHLAIAMELDPAQPSPYFMLGELLRRQGNRSAALLAYMAFLHYESNTDRSYRAAANLINSMHAPKADDKPAVVTVDLSDELMEGYSGLQMAYYTAKIERTNDDKLVEPLGENIASALHAFLRLVAAVEFDIDDRDILVDQLLPKSVRIVEAGSAESFAWFVVALARIPGAREWLDTHSAEVDQLNDLLNSRDASSR